MRVGVIGAELARGWATRAHFPALQGLPGIDLFAVADPEQPATAVADQWGAQFTCTSPTELATHRQVDIVTIAGPVPGHDDLVRTALSAGKHVFCEWPLTTNVHSAIELRTLAAQSGVHHVVGLRGRADPGVRFVRDLLAHGEIGEVLGVTLSAAPATSPEFSVGESLLTGDGGQALDILRFCLGELAELSATFATRCPGVISPDQVLVQGLLESGVALSVHLQAGAPGGTGFRMEVQGRRGALILVCPGRIGEQESTVLLARGSRGRPSTMASRTPTVSAEARIASPATAMAEPGAVTSPDEGEGFEAAALRVTGTRADGRPSTVLAVPGQLPSWGTAATLELLSALEVLPVPESYRSGVAAVPAGPAQGVARLYAELVRAVRTGTPQDPDFTTAVGLHCLLDTVAEAASSRRCRSFG
ncbi:MULTISPECIES: Gfo/Idh/MocA family protein [unclassified Crossiella]|uniref:Gfo/Idh/MocA family protein n=1 Tax=unclassified Crossiella TaxID=2620835 RepID=UPI00200025EC|nr:MULTISPECIES: Gfo/Idh/MocA family oxidoreductase [unclassified Crossiella]MCK2240312.1 Gfo/Idh/MocA family oxidoreductase [Crossiella sp. S99.2]MCK2253236.1 Gfo/Idh/MocA family oxidoreductase [Crossiella sp. S99.1]